MLKINLNAYSFTNPFSQICRDRPFSKTIESIYLFQIDLNHLIMVIQPPMTYGYRYGLPCLAHMLQVIHDCAHQIHLNSCSKWNWMFLNHVYLKHGEIFRMLLILRHTLLIIYYFHWQIIHYYLILDIIFAIAAPKFTKSFCFDTYIFRSNNSN